MFGFRKKPASPFAVLGTDMHCHLIPRVDDGSKSIDETVECITTMYELGYRRMFITPHFQTPRFPNKEEDIRQRYEELKQQLKERNVPMELIGIGGEYRVDDAFTQRIEESNFLRVGDKVLIELSLHQMRMGVEETLFELAMKDYDIILAHPERYPYFNEHSETLAALKEQGVYFQVNVLSLSGFYGDVAQRNALAYIKKGWVEYLGTDMHNPMYARGLREAATNRKVLKVLKNYQFQNNQL